MFILTENFIQLNLLPVISSFTTAFSTGSLSTLPAMPDTVTDTLLCIWILCMAPRGQKCPTVPSSSSIFTTMLSLHGCPGRSCLRGPMGEVSSTEPSRGGLSDQVTLLRGAGMQDGSRGTMRWTAVLGQSLSCLHSDKKRTN